MIHPIGEAEATAEEGDDTGTLPELGLPDTFAEEVASRMAMLAQPIVLFGIPLKARSVSQDWTQVQENLRRTMRSIARQTDQNFMIVVCGHDKPDFGEYAHLATWLPVTWPEPTEPSQFSGDKMKKRRHILVRMRRLARDGLYYFLMDADDLIADSVVAHIRSDHNSRGYLVDKGYVLDAAAGAIAKLNPQTKPFYRACGSCAAFWLRPKDMPARHSDKTAYFCTLRDHTKYREATQAAGRPIVPFPFYAAIYLLNHGSNNTLLKGNNVHNTRHASEHEITDPERISRILTGFPGVDAFLQARSPLAVVPDGDDGEDRDDL